MQQQKIINKLLKRIEEKQKKEEYGEILIIFEKGVIKKINYETSEIVKEEANEYKKQISE